MSSAKDRSTESDYPFNAEEVCDSEMERGSIDLGEKIEEKKKRLEELRRMREQRLAYYYSHPS